MGFKSAIKGLNTQIYTAKHTEYDRAFMQAVCTQQRDNHWRTQPKLRPLDQFLQLAL
jgi:hypothetical protein